MPQGVGNEFVNLFYVQLVLPQYCAAVLQRVYFNKGEGFDRGDKSCSIVCSVVTAPH